ncbi:transposase, partial [bacterium]|nr:transposase [bacterium]
MAHLRAELETQKALVSALLTRIYGAKSEKMSHDQLLLAFLEDESKKPEAADGNEEPPAAKNTKPKRAKRTNKLLHSLEGLPTIERTITDPEVLANPEDFRLLSEEVSVRLHASPATFTREIIKRQTHVRKNDPDAIPFTPPLEPCLLPGSVLTPSLGALLLTEKFCYHQPFYRQQWRLFASHGIEITRNNMCNWHDHLTDLLLPLYQRIATSLRQVSYLKVDETPIDCLEPGTRKFKEQQPNGFGPLAKAAKGFGGRLGVWLGPDGFGDTPAEEDARIDFLSSLCRDHNFQLFKMDAVCGQLRDEKQDAFIRLMKECRKHSEDLIVLNHRLNLGEAAPYVNTFLWQGAETYIDVHMSNNMTATHNRAKALGRGLPPELKRMAEDHGVCLSSCLDYWAEDLILQAFNRSMLLAPQVYGSPWFLRDDEYPKLARIFNLHRRYNKILINGIVLPVENYGPNAVSRGNGKTRLITLRNTSWEPVKRTIALDSAIGLTDLGKRHVRLFHPYEEVLGNNLKPTNSIEVTIHPFRSLLLLVTSENCPEPSLESGPYNVIKSIEGEKPVIEKLPPIKLKKSWHRKLADLTSVDLPTDWEALYESTCFAADNNALEIRSLDRSGPTKIAAVQNARQEFLAQPLIKGRALWDQFLFDGDISTVFDVYATGRDARLDGGSLRVDFANMISFDHIILKTQAQDRTLIRLQLDGAEFSQDLKIWIKAEEIIQDGADLILHPPKEGKFRYFRMKGGPERISEIEAWNSTGLLPRNRWRANNLFAHSKVKPATSAWQATVKVDELTPTSYLCVAVEGEHGVEGAYAAIRIGDRLIGAPRRAASYPTNAWEYPVRKQKTGYTYFFPLDESMLNQ